MTAELVKPHKVICSSVVASNSVETEVAWEYIKQAHGKQIPLILEV